MSDMRWRWGLPGQASGLYSVVLRGLRGASVANHSASFSYDLGRRAWWCLIGGLKPIIALPHGPIPL